MQNTVNLEAVKKVFPYGQTEFEVLSALLSSQPAAIPVNASMATLKTSASCRLLREVFAATAE